MTMHPRTLQMDGNLESQVIAFTSALAPDGAPDWAHHVVACRVIRQVSETQDLSTAEILQQTTRQWSKVYVEHNGDSWDLKPAEG